MKNQKMKLGRHFVIVSSLDGELISSDIEHDRASRVALMGAIMYGSMKSLDPSGNPRVVKAVLPEGMIAVKREHVRLQIEFMEIDENLEKP